MHWCNPNIKYKAKLFTKERFFGVEKLNIIKNKQIEANLTPRQRVINRIEAVSLHRTNLGLLMGKMGIAIIFFHYSRTSGNLLYEKYANKIIDDIFDRVSTTTPLSFKDGLCGIAWGICYLVVKNGADCYSKIGHAVTVLTWQS